MLKLILIRHGQTQWNAEKRIMGRTDVPLNAVGQKQIQASSAMLEGLSIDQVLSSPQLRALETAQPIARPKGLAIEMEPRLSELRFDRWVGKVLDEIKDDPVYKERRQNLDMQPHPEIETVNECMARTKELLDELTSKQGCIVCVSHMDVLAAMVLHIQARPKEDFFQTEIENATPMMFVYENKHWRPSEIIER